MIKTDDFEKQQNYQKRIEPYRIRIKELLQKEEAILAECRRDSSTAAVKLFFLADRMLNVASNYLVINGIGAAMFEIKDEESLSEAKKFYSKALIYLENIVTGKVDVPFSDYADALAELRPVYMSQRCNLVKKLGLTCSLLKIAYGDNTKWRWVFVDMEGLCAAVSKNLLDLKRVQSNTDASSPDYEPIIYHTHFVKKMLTDAADRFYARYSLATKRSEDLRKAINFLSALNRIHSVLNEKSEAEDSKKKLDNWQNRLDNDLKKYSAK
ncbi:MAG: hypothetical protein LBJ35_06640 [Spirochaetaceae bacterium]|jgi:hypothetical protein|nr:hypothetical protein [Spirochaetaceae bacterium]